MPKRSLSPANRQGRAHAITATMIVPFSFWGHLMNDNW
jgi:hypothetical protein